MQNINSCVEKSFAVPGDYESDNKFLKNDRQWAWANHLHMHPTITVNNITYSNSTGQDLALAICQAYRQAPDECELSWKINSFMNETEYEGLLTPHEADQIYDIAREKALRKSEEELVFGSWHLYAIVFGVVLINVGALFIVYTRQKRRVASQMNSQVQAAVSQYFALSAGDAQE